PAALARRPPGAVRPRPDRVLGVVGRDQRAVLAPGEPPRGALGTAPSAPLHGARADRRRRAREGARTSPGPPGLRGAGGRLSGVQLLAWSASISFGSTLCTSPTMPRSATPKIGASWSLLTAMMCLEPFMPTMCWVAPEMPAAM